MDISSRKLWINGCLGSLSSDYMCGSHIHVLCGHCHCHEFSKSCVVIAMNSLMGYGCTPIFCYMWKDVTCNYYKMDIDDMTTLLAFHYKLWLYITHCENPNWDLNILKHHLTQSLNLWIWDNYVIIISQLFKNYWYCLLWLEQYHFHLSSLLTINHVRISCL